MSLEEVMRVLDPLPDLQSVALQVNGEPLLYGNLPEVLTVLKSRNVFVELNTNGVAIRLRRLEWLLRCGLDQLNVSIEGSTRDTYKRVRGIDAFDRVVRNLENFLALRGPAPRKPRVSLWMTAGRANFHELPDVVNLAARVGAEEVFLQRLVCFGEGMAAEECAVHGKLTSDDDAVLAEATRRANRAGVTLRTCGRHDPTTMLASTGEPEPWRKCGRAWESAAVMADGDVVPCCISTFVAPLDEIRMGNVFELGWRSVWYGAAFERHRELLLEGPGPEYCRRCGVDWSL